MLDIRFRPITLAVSLLLSSSLGMYAHQTRVYVDMVADLFHYGHVNFLRQAKEHGDYLIVGLCADEDVASYKRWPILTLEERVKSVKDCPLVDEVIPGCPLCITQELIDQYKIDLVIHGDDMSEEQLAYYYAVPIRMGIFKTVPYTKAISTSEIIARVQKRSPSNITLPK